MRHPVSYLFYISSLGRRVLASADTRQNSRYWCGMTTDITAQQPGTAALLTGDVYILPTIQQTAGGQRCSKYSFQIVTVDVVDLVLVCYVCIEVIQSVMRRVEVLLNC